MSNFRPDQDVVRHPSNPIHPTGGFVIMRGNLAPEGGVLKITGTTKRFHRGPAKVFDCEEDAFKAVSEGKIQAGDVVVIRYEGPKGGPGMREMLAVTAALVGEGVKRRGRTADGREVLWSNSRFDDWAHFTGGNGWRSNRPR
jgi:dihydroxy-acid dehydratase